MRLTHASNDGIWSGWLARCAAVNLFTALKTSAGEGLFVSWREYECRKKITSNHHRYLDTRCAVICSEQGHGRCASLLMEHLVLDGDKVPHVNAPGLVRYDFQRHMIMLGRATRRLPEELEGAGAEYGKPHVD